MNGRRDFRTEDKKSVMKTGVGRAVSAATETALRAANP